MGGGSASYFPKPSSMKKVLGQTEKTEQQAFDGEVNETLQKALSSFNARDTDKINSYLDSIQQTLGDKISFEKILFGGSVAKHTYVDGLSDVDSLVILGDASQTPDSPDKVLNKFLRTLKNELKQDSIKLISKGKLAITITYKDGNEIQLLPAVRIGTKIGIPSANAKSWNEINPNKFNKQLTEANKKTNNSLVPAIKIVKSIIAGLPEKKQLSGYHIEALSLEAVKKYRGSMTVKAIVQQIMTDSSKRVKTSIKDQTGQSSTIDAYLGKSNSTERLVISDALATIARKLNAATKVEQWKSVIGIE